MKTNQKDRRNTMHAHWERNLLNLAGNIPHPSTRPIFSYWAGDAALEEAYDLCGRVAAEHSKSFYMASGLLPEEKRSAARALYAFCRVVDDIVDEGSVIGRDVELDYWRGVVQGLVSPRADDLVAQAWADTRSRYHIPPRYALQLIDGGCPRYYPSPLQNLRRPGDLLLWRCIDGWADEYVHCWFQI
jgi:15-cis-phytoene synthase